MTVSGIISELGGPAEVAQRLGIKAGAARMWSLRERVPARHALALWRLAHDAGLDWRPPGCDGIELARHRAASPAEQPAQPSAAA